MHIDFIAEGIADELDEFEKWWSTRIVPMKIKKADGIETTAMVQAALRPRRAYSLIFPKEYEDAVMNTLNPEDCIVSRVDGKGTKQFGLIFRTLRKLLKLKPLSKKDPAKGFLPMRAFNNVRIIGIGKRDDFDVTEADGGVHEGL